MQSQNQNFQRRKCLTILFWRLSSKSSTTPYTFRTGYRIRNTNYSFNRHGYRIRLNGESRSAKNKVYSEK